MGIELSGFIIHGISWFGLQKRSLGRTRGSWEYNIRMDLKEKSVMGNWIDSTQ